MTIQSHGVILSDDSVLSIMAHLREELTAATVLLHATQVTYRSYSVFSGRISGEREKLSQALSAAETLISSATVKYDRVSTRQPLRQGDRRDPLQV